jgi:predicted Ser/Thr protein kinase
LLNGSEHRVNVLMENVFNRCSKEFSTFFMASELMPVVDLEIEATIRNLSRSQVVFGRYTLREVLGRGGMGVVWLAHDERLDRLVALKFLSDVIQCDPSALDDLKKETRRCLELTHPNIVRIYDFVKDDQAAAISMEYIDGKTLTSCRLGLERRVLEVDELRGWLLQACQALQYAHEDVGVVHRDLKPGNLMLTSRGQMKITDFGIARSVSDSLSKVTMRRGTSGTLAYMSPQQMNGDLPRVTDDIYALGATIYELLTGKPPFHRGDITHQARTSVPASMTERRKEFGLSGQPIPPEWEHTLAACLEKMPDLRPASMNELSERLGLVPMTVRGVVAAKPEENVRPPPFQVPWPKFKLTRGSLAPLFTRRRLLIAGSVLTLVLAGVPLWNWLAKPYLATPGSVAVDSQPTGATVHLAGQSDQVTPALFPHLRIGSYRIILAKEGFAPVEQELTVREGVRTTLGSIPLQRLTGALSLLTLPAGAHYVLTGDAATGNFQNSGTTPDFLGALPSGHYQLNVTSSEFSTVTRDLDIPNRGTLTEKIDLVQMTVVSHADPKLAQVFRGETDISQIDSQDRSQLANLFSRSFEGYLRHDLLAPADVALLNLQKLGVDTTKRQIELAHRRTELEQETSAQLERLMHSGKCALVTTRLQELQASLGKESADRLTAEFQAPLLQYQQTVDAALQKAAQENPAAAFQDLKTLTTVYPDDTRLQLALAQAQMQMPPDRTRLEAQAQALRTLAQHDSRAATDPDLLGVQAKLTDELNKLDAYSQSLADLKHGVSSPDRLAELKAEKAALARQRVGRPKNDVFSKTLNFFGKAMTGHAVVGAGAYFSSEEQKEEAIQSVQEQISSEEKCVLLPPCSLQDAQKRYDEWNDLRKSTQLRS